MNSEYSLFHRSDVRLRFAWFVCFFVLCGLFVIVNGTWMHSTPSRALDGSWAFVLHAMAGQVRFGSELIFTYGPLGFLFVHGDTPATMVWRLLFEGALLVVVFWMIYLLRFHGEQGAARNLKNLCGFAAVVGVMSVAFGSGRVFPDVVPVIIVLLGIVLLMRLTDDKDRLYRIGIGLVLAAMALAKGTLLAVVCVLLLVLVFRRLVLKRGHLDVVFALLGWGALLWVLSGNALGDFPQYLIASKEIATGFSTAMQAEGVRQLQVRLLFLVISGLMAYRYSNAVGNTSLDRWLTAAMVFLICLVLTKHATERFDRHVFGPSHVMLALSWLSFLFPREKRLAKVGSCVLVVLASVLMYSALKAQSTVSAQERMRRVLIGDRFNEYVRSQWRLFWAIGDEVKAEPGNFKAAVERVGKGLPEVGADQTVDIYSYGQGVVLAKGLRYQPRPIYQSYSAYTPWLAERNRDFLRTERAPDRIFFAVEPIDERLAAMDDGLSWFELATRYQLNGMFRFAGELFLDLQKKPQGAASYRYEQAIAEQTVDIDQWYSLPAHPGPLWLSGTRSGRGWLASAKAQLIRNPIYWLTLELDNGQLVRRRVIEPLLASGFVASPFVGSTQDYLAMLTAKDWAAAGLHGVKRFKIECSQQGSCPVTQWRMAVAPVSFKLDASWTDKAKLNVLPPATPLDALEQGVLGESLAFVRTEDGHTVFFAHAPTHAEASPADLGLAGAKRVRACFGLFAQAYQEGVTDGVGFVVLASDEGGAPHAVWSRILKPKQTEQDRGEQCAEFDLSGRQTNLTFLTEPLESDAWDWAYWSRLERVN